MTRTLCFDVEADRLSGRPFAFGGVALDVAGSVLSTLYRELHPHLHDPSAWVVENVYPALAGRRATTPDCWCDAVGMYASVWAWLQEWRSRAVCVVDCGAPVEGGFLRDLLAHVAVAGIGSEFDGPYPLYDVATALCVVGHGDPDRLAFAGLRPSQDVPGVGRIAVHDPVCDAYASALSWRRVVS